MTRLINADELKNLIIKKLGIASEEFLLESEKAVFEEIDNAPTVDAEPVRHGHWNGIEKESRGYTDIFECSECKCYVRTPFMMKVMEYDFCPSCGAKMDGEEE